MREFLAKNADVPAAWAEECMSLLLADAETAGFVRSVKGGAYIDVSGAPRATDPTGAETAIDDGDTSVESDERTELDERRGREPKASGGWR